MGAEFCSARLVFDNLELVMIAFKGANFSKDVILFAVFFHVRYTVSYRDLEVIMTERGTATDHATLNRWVTRFAPLPAEEARRRKLPANRSCGWMNLREVRCEWVYLYRAIDKCGKTLDFMGPQPSASHLSETLVVNGNFLYRSTCYVLPSPGRRDMRIEK